MKTMVIYHGDNCADGFLSAYIAYLSLGSIDVEYRAVSYGDPIPDFTDKAVYILDFSYPPKELVKAALTAVSVQQLDHHKSAFIDWLKFTGEYNEVGELPRCIIENNTYHNLVVEFDMNLSGVGMTWNNFSFASKLSSLINFEIDHDFVERVKDAVQDRDLWKKELPFTEEICAGLNLVPRTFEAYDELFKESDIETLILQGKTLVAQKKVLCESIAKRATAVFFAGYQVLIVNCNKEHSSEVGHILAENTAFSISYEIVGEGVSVSLRSRPEGEDVSLIAKRYGGGGHRGAAGIKMSLKSFMSHIH